MLSPFYLLGGEILHKKTKIIAIFLCLCLIITPMLSIGASATGVGGALSIFDALVELQYKVLGISRTDADGALMLELCNLLKTGTEVRINLTGGTVALTQYLSSKLFGLNEAYDDLSKNLVTLPDGTQILQFNTTYGDLKEGTKALQELIGYKEGGPISGTSVFPTIEGESSGGYFYVKNYMTLLDGDDLEALSYPKIISYDFKTGPEIYINFSTVSGISSRSFRILYSNLEANGRLRYKVIGTSYKTDGTIVKKESFFTRAKDDELLGIGFFETEFDPSIPEDSLGFSVGVAYRYYDKYTSSDAYRFFEWGENKLSKVDIPIDDFTFSFAPAGQVADVIGGYNDKTAGKSISYDFGQLQRVLDYLDSQATAADDVITLDVPLTNTDAGLVIDEAYITNLYRMLSRDLVRDMVDAGVISKEEAGTATGEAEADLTLWGIPDLIFLFVKILIECIKLLSRCFVFVGTLHFLEPNPGILPPSLVSGYDMVRNTAIPGFNMTYFEAVQTVTLALFGFAVVKAVIRGYRK